MRALRVTSAIPDPEHVRRAVVPQAGQGVPARERFLVREQESFVAGPDVDLVQCPLRREVDPDRLHEPQRALDLVRERFVALARR